MKKYATGILIALSALTAGGLTFWAVSPNEVRKIEKLAEHALCTLELEPEVPSTSTLFTLSKSVDRLHLGVKFGARDERLSISISGGGELFASVTLSRYRSHRFSFSREFPAGTYTLSLRQEAGSGGGSVVIADAVPPAGVTGWQVVSRIVLAWWALLVFGRSRSAGPAV